jgi:ApaG protein
MYSETTQNVTVTVVPTFLPDQSEPESSKFFWAYTIRIQNSGAETVQLLNRHWRIIDANGQTQEVKGAGVVGEQPVLGPGESFEYTSGAPLPTPSGFMVGSYEMATQGGRHFDVGIPAFSLDSPHGQQQIH